MSELGYFNFTVPEGCTSIPKLNKILTDFEDNFSYSSDRIQSQFEKTHHLLSFEACIEFSDMPEVEDFFQPFIKETIPFDVVISESLETPETHYIFRKGMKEPYRYFGSEQVVPVSTLREIIASDPDFTREHLIEYLDAHHPELPPIETAAKDWELKQKYVRSGQSR